LAPPVGECAGRMTQGGTIPRIVLTDGDPDPLQSLREEIKRRMNSNWRIVRLRLLPTEVEHGSLMGIGLTCVRLYNELNYEKRQAFFKGELTRDKMYEIDRRYYYKYKDVLGVNAQAVIQKNDEAWISFFELLKLKKQGRLPPHIRKVSPPGYWKDRFTGRREVRILIRNDRYHLEPVDENGIYLVLEDFGLRIRFAGRIRWEGKQGRLVIMYVSGKMVRLSTNRGWERTTKSNKKGYVRPNYRDRRGRIVNPKSIKQRDPIGDEKAFMDMSLNNLFAVVTTNGYVLLVKGGVIKSEYYWWKREISIYQAVRDLLRNAGLPTWVYYHEMYLEAMHTRDERLRHLYRTSIRFLAETLWSRGVRKLYVGYPIMLS